MQVTDCTAKNATSTEADAAAVIQALQATLKASQAEVAALKRQLDWFKRQLFGRKSEKRIIDSPDQLDLSALQGDAHHRPSPPKRSPIAAGDLSSGTKTMSLTPAYASALRFPLR